MTKTKQTSFETFVWLIIVAGTACCAYAAINFPFHLVDRYFIPLIAGTVLIGSRVAIRIPRINTNITVDDTFVFIALLLYGGETAVLMGALAGICGALRISRRFRTVALASG